MPPPFRGRPPDRAIAQHARASAGSRGVPLPIDALSTPSSDLDRDTLDSRRPSSGLGLPAALTADAALFDPPHQPFKPSDRDIAPPIATDENVIDACALFFFRSVGNACGASRPPGGRSLAENCGAWTATRLLRRRRENMWGTYKPTYVRAIRGTVRRTSNQTSSNGLPARRAM